jgi:hypothetical protein
MQPANFVGFIQSLIGGPKPNVAAPCTNRKIVAKKTVRQRLEEDRASIMASKGIVLPLYDKAEIERRAAIKQENLSVESEKSRRDHVRRGLVCVGGVAAFCLIVKLT